MTSKFQLLGQFKIISRKPQSLYNYSNSIRSIRKDGFQLHAANAKKKLQISVRFLCNVC